MTPDDSKRGTSPRPRRVGESFLGKSWGAKLLPNSLVYQSLTVGLTAPNTVEIGKPTDFALQIRNRLPVAVSLSLPTSRVWGWAVDDFDEADEREHSPPDYPRTISLSSRGNRRFEWSWNGTIRRTRDDSKDEWVPAMGTHEITAYIAIPDWETRNAFDRTNVTVVK
jgi:hypothetical protein